MRVFRTTLLLLSIGTVPVFAGGISAPLSTLSSGATAEDPGELTLPFSLTSETQIPGKVLKPGSYTLRVVDHLRDRVVLKIENTKGKTESVFLGLPNSNLGSATGPVNWTNAGKHSALRGFVFPGGSSVEFVYQKEQAVEIAKATSMKVPAIDPASEGMPTNRTLSNEDMTIITLWKLSPTQVGPFEQHQIGIQAERVTPPVTMPAPVQTASAEVKSPTSSTQSNPVAVPVLRKPKLSPSTQIATLHRPSLVSSLPHTGSELPTVLLAGFAFLGMACGLRLVRSREA